MELLTVKLVALLRPLASVEYAAPIFEAMGVGLFGLLVSGFLIKSAVQRTLRLSAVDGVIVFFVIWCLATSAIYSQAVRIGEVAKLLLPLLSYTIVKNVLVDQTEHGRMLWWALIGLSAPIIASALLITIDSPVAVDMVNYWTQVTRWKGAFTHSHVLGHSATLTLMAVTIYLLSDKRDHHLAASVLFERLFLLVLALASAYCLYMSQVRSAILGLIAFGLIFLFFQNRKALLFGGTAAVVVAISTFSYWYAAMLPEAVTAERGIEVKATDWGSGRPNFWLNDLRIYARLPLDQKLGGVGIGARGEYSVTDEEIIGHSDWLELLTQTGIVGFLLFAALQVLILTKILRVPGRERYLFLSVFLAVNFMMLVSNSYAWRIQVSQLYYMILAFIELPPSNPVVRVSEQRAQSVSVA